MVGELCGSFIAMDFRTFFKSGENNIKVEIDSRTFTSWGWTIVS